MRTVPRRLRAATAVVSGIALFALSTTFATAAPSEEPAESNDSSSESSLGSGRVQHLDLSWTRVHAHFNDVAPEGTSSGDTVQFSKKITGRVKGSADYTCTVVQENFLCDGIIHLAKGDIYVSTGPLDDDVEPAAILGGTGSYMGIRGQFTKTNNSDDSQGTYRLRFVQ
ncbi:hypothetical protein CLV29_3133 [Naumannella halotolerans]|uniref:Dirigent-like protein n=1 Tax=Naumannella halotolerans TaxID=993414 RepID=A0A4R7J1I1_9ACTN|nr:hypothetical protein CLV29_3133 [Naumannella halotolerans]